MSRPLVDVDCLVVADAGEFWHLRSPSGRVDTLVAKVDCWDTEPSMIANGLGAIIVVKMTEAAALDSGLRSPVH